MNAIRLDGGGEGRERREGGAVFLARRAAVAEPERADVPGDEAARLIMGLDFHTTLPAAGAAAAADSSVPDAVHGADPDRLQGDGAIILRLRRGATALGFHMPPLPWLWPPYQPPADDHGFGDHGVS
ncbi:MAG: hypothetical protein R3F60_04665 [bacterium]